MQECRTRLNECADESLSIDAYRDDLVEDCNVAVDLLNELKEFEQRLVELDKTCDSVKDQSNKLQYSTAVKERVISKKKMREISKEINNTLRFNPTIVKNQKRISLLMENLDDLLCGSIKDLHDTAHFSTLSSSTRQFTSPEIVKDAAFTKMKNTIKCLQEVRESSSREHIEHRTAVEQLKNKIKKTRADLDAIDDGSYAHSIERQFKLSERRRISLACDDDKRNVIEAEIGMCLFWKLLISMHMFSLL